MKKLRWLVAKWDGVVEFTARIHHAILIYTLHLWGVVVRTWEKLSPTLLLWRILGRLKISFFFAWYDFWIGMFYDQKKKVLYICPVPCCVVKIEKRPKEFRLDHELAEIIARRGFLNN